MDTLALLRSIGALLVVLALLAGAALALRRYGGQLAGLGVPVSGRTPRRLAVVEQLTLDGRHKLLLIRCGKEEHLLGLGPQGLAQISVVHPSETLPS